MFHVALCTVLQFDSLSLRAQTTMTDFHPLRSINDVASSEWQALNKAAENRAQQTTLATVPSLAHASMKDFDNVYEPSDDTYLLIDGIQDDVSSNRAAYEERFKTALEIGCGSAVPIVHLAKLLPNVLPMATDINPTALEFAKRTAVANGVANLHTIQCDLATDLLSDYQHRIDVLIFNPPYVPTPDDEVTGNGIEASWAGGEKGRRVIDRAIPQIAQLLSIPHGVCYMITVDDNEPEELARIFATFQMHMEPFVRRRARNEYLTVQKITPIQKEATE